MSEIVFLILRILIALLIYGFIGWAVYTIWMDSRIRAIAPIDQVPSLIIQFTDRRGSQVVFFTKPIIQMGRDASMDCRIHDETISNRHARISYHHHQWWLEDLDSMNGTFLNNERITSPTVIIAEDQIRLGAVPFTLQIGSA